jgi:hypothetical protein
MYAGWRNCIFDKEIEEKNRNRLRLRLGGAILRFGVRLSQARHPIWLLCESTFFVLLGTGLVTI